MLAAVLVRSTCGSPSSFWPVHGPSIRWAYAPLWKWDRTQSSRSWRRAVLDALQSAQCLWLSSLKRPATPEAPAEDMTHLWTVAASLYAHGTQLEWAALYPEGSFARTTLPLYPWDMKHYDLAQQQQQSPPPRASSRARAAVVGEPFEEEPQHQQQPSATSVVAAPSSGNSGVDARAAIRRILGELLGVSDVDDQTPLQQLGLDSLLAMQFSTQLSRVLGKPVPATLAISLRTVAAIADFVAPAATTTATIADFCFFVVIVIVITTGTEWCYDCVQGRGGSD